MVVVVFVVVIVVVFVVVCLQSVARQIFKLTALIHKLTLFGFTLFQSFICQENGEGGGAVSRANSFSFGGYEFHSISSRPILYWSEP